MLENEKVINWSKPKIEKIESWIDENRGAVIFWACAAGITIFGIVPYCWGWVSILKTIF